MERRIRAFIRWNAAVMVTRANILSDGIGGHLATYASSASLYEVGFNHFFRGKADGNFGDQELEAVFRGAGWNVIKVIWGRGWDKLLAQDTDGVLLNRMNTTVDGDFQKYATESGEYIREHFFGPDPRLVYGGNGAKTHRNGWELPEVWH